MATHTRVIVSLESQHLRIVLPVLWFSGRELSESFRRMRRQPSVQSYQMSPTHTTSPGGENILPLSSVTGYNLALRVEGVFPILP